MPCVETITSPTSVSSSKRTNVTYATGILVESGISRAQLLRFCHRNNDVWTWTHARTHVRTFREQAKCSAGTNERGGGDLEKERGIPPALAPEAQLSSVAARTAVRFLADARFSGQFARWAWRARFLPSVRILDANFRSARYHVAI